MKHVLKILYAHARLQQRRPMRKKLFEFYDSKPCHISHKTIISEGYRMPRLANATCQVPLSCCTCCFKRQTSSSQFMSSSTFSRESHPTFCQSVDALYKANSITGIVSVYLSAGCTMHHIMPCHHTSIAPLRRVADSRTITVPELSFGVWYIPAATKSDLALQLHLQRSSWCSQFPSTYTNQTRVLFPSYRQAETASTITGYC